MRTTARKKHRLVPGSLTGKRESLTLAEERDALYEQAKRTYRVMALPRRRWEALKDEHPPRKDDDGNIEGADADQGVNVSTFFEAVIPESIVTVDDDPRSAERMFSDREAEDFIGELSGSDWRELCSIVWVVNEVGVGIPKLSMASVVRQRIDADSEPQEPSESPSEGSKAGSRFAGPNTSTQPAT